MAAAAGLSLDRLRALNPAVNCSGRLYFGQALCVEVEAVVPSTPSSDAARAGVAVAGAPPPPGLLLGRHRRSARSSHSDSGTTRERFLAEQHDAPPPSEDDGNTNIGGSGGGGDGDGGGGGSSDGGDGGVGGGGGSGGGGGDGGDGGSSSNGSNDAPPPNSSDDTSSPSPTEADASPPDGSHHDSEAPPPTTPDTADTPDTGDDGAHFAPPPDPLGEHGADTPPEDTGGGGGSGTSGTGGDCSRFGAICAACNAEGCTQLVSGLPPPVEDEFNIVAALPNGQQLMLLSSDAPTTPRGSLCDKPDPNNLTPCTMISVGKFASSVMAPGSGGDDDLSKFTRLGQDWFEREFDNACQDGACHSTSPHDVSSVRFACWRRYPSYVLLSSPPGTRSAHTHVYSTLGCLMRTLADEVCPDPPPSALPFPTHKAIYAGKPNQPNTHATDQPLWPYPYLHAFATCRLHRHMQVTVWGSDADLNCDADDGSVRALRPAAGREVQVHLEGQLDC